MSAILDTLGNNTESPSHPYDLTDFAYRLSLQSYARTLIPNHRMRICLRNRRQDSDNVTLVHDSQSERIKFNGLMVCKNVWVCPICTKRIMTERALQIERALRVADSKGLHTYLLTVTLKHKKTDRLTYLLDGLNKSYKYLFSGKIGQALKKELGYVGGIKALEIKWGYSNGFHPHNHVVLITDKPLVAVNADKSPREGESGCNYSIETILRNRWVKALNHYGYEGDYEVSLDLRESKIPLFNYLTKQASLALELTHNQNKSSSHHLSPLALLDEAYNGDSECESAWVEYAESTFGQRMITMSKGLKALLEIHDIKESESLADREDSAPYGVFTARVWGIIRKHSTDLRSSILRIANNNPVHVLIDYLVGVGCLHIDDAITIHPDNPVHAESLGNGDYPPTRTRYFDRESIIEF